LGEKNKEAGKRLQGQSPRDALLKSKGGKKWGTKKKDRGEGGGQKDPNYLQVPYHTSGKEKGG